jgi:hypothetical protein
MDIFETITFRKGASNGYHDASGRRIRRISGEYRRVTNFFLADAI